MVAQFIFDAKENVNSYSVKTVYSTAVTETDGSEFNNFVTTNQITFPDAEGQAF